MDRSFHPPQMCVHAPPSRARLSFAQAIPSVRCRRLRPLSWSCTEVLMHSTRSLTGRPLDVSPSLGTRTNPGSIALACLTWVCGPKAHLHRPAWPSAPIFSLDTRLRHQNKTRCLACSRNVLAASGAYITVCTVLSINMYSSYSVQNPAVGNLAWPCYRPSVGLVHSRPRTE